MGDVSTDFEDHELRQFKAPVDNNLTNGHQEEESVANGHREGQSVANGHQGADINMDDTNYHLVGEKYNGLGVSTDMDNNGDTGPLTVDIKGTPLHTYHVTPDPRSHDPTSGNNYNDDSDDVGNNDDEVLSVSAMAQAVSMINIVVIVLTPIVLLPIILKVDDSYQTEARCGYVICIMAVYWTTEAVPIAVTALLPVVLFPMLGVMTARDTSGAYFNDTSMLFVGGLLVAIAIEVWDVHKRIALLTVRAVGAEPKSLLLGITLVTWFLSMWISNTATTAMMMTMAQALLDQYKEVYKQRDRCLQQQSRPRGQSPRLEMSKASEKEYLKLCKAVSLTVAYAANIGGIGSLTGTGPNLIFYSAAQRLFEPKGLSNPVNFGTWLAFGLPLSLVLVLVQWAWMVCFFLRCSGTWPCACCKKQGGPSGDVDRVNTVIRQEYRKMGPVSTAQKTIMIGFILLVFCWISRDLGGTGGWGDWFPTRMVSDSTPSILFGVLMFVLPSNLPRLCGKGGKKGRYIRVKPLLTWNNVQEKMPWNLYLVLGGGYALARASSQSGLSEWLGQQLLVFKGMNPWLILLIICYVVAFATEVTSNSATATLMMPILSQMAISLQVNPLFFMYPAAMATSFAFMLPAATPPNAIVFSRGVVRVIDMVSCGIALNIVCVPILVMASATWGNALFHFDTIQPEFLRNTTLPDTI